MAELEIGTLGGGCFWCIEAAYQLINGVTKATSGYVGKRARKAAKKAQ